MISFDIREPGGVLFEITTDNPGFATDETLEVLGSSFSGLLSTNVYGSVLKKVA